MVEQGLLKRVLPQDSISDSCETLLAPRIRLLLGGFRSYQTCWFWVVCGHWPPSWLGTSYAYPGSSFDSCETLFKGAGNTARSGVCTLSNMRLLLGAGETHTAQSDSRSDSCETGFGAEGRGFAAIRYDAVGADGVGYEAAKPRVTGCSLSWWWAPLGVVKRGANATPWS